MNDWMSGNEFELLENGEAFFPRLFEAIEAAEREVLLETYIWRDDDIGRRLTDTLVEAAAASVRVTVTIDGYGSASFSETLLQELADAGVTVCTYDYQPKFLRMRTNVFCRLHRKIVVVDRRLALIGGINIWGQHLRRGDDSMQDYAVAVKGPVVDGIHAVTCRGVERGYRSPWRRWRSRIRPVPRELGHPREDGQALFVTRDNNEHPTDIETMYRVGIQNARSRILIANAYFFPGYWFLRDLTRAARRGVDVRLILQGRPDVEIMAMVGSILYNHMFAAGIRVFHYKDRPLHAKVAVIDSNWATVGSSNLDPISLGLNLEANLFVLDRPFATELGRRLHSLMDKSCEEVTAEVSRDSFLRRIVLMLLYHLTRRMPRWGSLVLRRAQSKQALHLPT